MAICSGSYSGFWWGEPEESWGVTSGEHEDPLKNMPELMQKPLAAKVLRGGHVFLHKCAFRAVASQIFP